MSFIELKEAAWECARGLWVKHYPMTLLLPTDITLRWQHGQQFDLEGMYIGRDFLLNELRGEEGGKKKGTQSVKNQKPLVVNVQVESSLLLAAQQEEELAMERLEEERTRVRHDTF